MALLRMCVIAFQAVFVTYFLLHLALVGSVSSCFRASKLHLL